LGGKKLEKRQVVCNFKSLITKQLQTKYLSLTDAKAVEIFYYADESSRQFDRAESGHLLKTDNGKKHRNRKFTMSDSGVMTVLILFHPGHYRDFKAFYTGHVQRYRTSDFPQNGQM
jgi:hypothetical protein